MTPEWQYRVEQLKQFIPTLSDRQAVEAAAMAFAASIPAIHQSVDQHRQYVPHGYTMTDDRAIIPVIVPDANPTDLLPENSDQQSRLQAFTTQHDIDRMLKIQALAVTNPDQAAKEQQQLLTMVDMNIDTFILEICGVEVYESYAKIDEAGRLVDVASGLDLVEMTEKAIPIARQLGNKEDYGRVVAEGKLMQQLHREVQLGKLKPGDIVVAASPKGSKQSVFQYNFADFIEVLPDGSTHLVRKHTSLASNEMMETSNHLHCQATGEALLQEFSVEALKARLVKTPSGTRLDDLFKLYKTTGANMSRTQAQAIIAILPEVKAMYKDDLKKIPPPKDRLESHVRSLVGVVHSAVKRLKQRPAASCTTDTSFAGQPNRRDDFVDFLPPPTRWEIASYSQQSFATFNLPCGRLGGDAVDIYRGSAAMVSRQDYFARLPDYGLTSMPLYTGFDLLNLNSFIQTTETSSDEKILPCTCPFCEEKVDAKIANGKISCPKCKKSVDYQC